jgi:DNA-binding transcriptional LysR family regulator
MDLRRVKYFVAVAEELHFAHAAQRLGMSQPPLSQQIKALEDEVGVRLFERNKHKVRLTTAGEAMLAEAYRLLEQAERVRVVARQASEGVVTSLDIGCVSSALFDVLPPILDRLHAEHPEIGLSLRDYETPAALAALMRGRLDAAFIRVDKVGPPLRSFPVVGDNYIAALHQRHPLARRRVVALKDLAEEPLVIYSRQISPRPYDTIIAACLRAGFSPNLAYQSGSIQSQIGFVACGLGIALVPGLVKHWRVPAVVYRDLDTRLKTTDVSLVWNTSARIGPVEVLIKAAQAAFPSHLHPRSAIEKA